MDMWTWTRSRASTRWETWWRRPACSCAVEGSFTVYGDTSRFHCFGCGATGDVLDFIQRTDGLSLPEAIRKLDGGAPSTVAAPRRAAESRRASAAVVPQRDPALLTAALRFYLRSMLRSREAREYLGSRGISFDTTCRLGLGYAVGDGCADTLKQPDLAATACRHRACSPSRGSGSQGWWWSRT